MNPKGRDHARLGLLSGFTTTPNTLRERVINSGAVWAALMAIWAVCDFLIAHHPSGGREMPPEGGTALVIFAVMGLIAIACAHRTGFPAAWDARIPATSRLLLPLSVGIVFGVVAALIEVVTRSLHILEAVFGPANVAFPGSVPVSISGAIKYELMFLIFPVSVLLWLISGLALRGRRERQTFWTLATLSAAIEPCIQGIPLMILSNGAIGPAAFGAYVIHSYAFNFTAGVSYRRYGLLAPVLVRLGNYLIWHVAYGNFFF
jgi:hypothetical protein